MSTLPRPVPTDVQPKTASSKKSPRKLVEQKSINQKLRDLSETNDNTSFVFRKRKNET